MAGPYPSKSLQVTKIAAILFLTPLDGKLTSFTSQFQLKDVEK